MSDFSREFQTTLLHFDIATAASVETASVDTGIFTHALFTVCADLVGGATLAIKVQDSANDSTFADVSGARITTISGDPGEIERTILVSHQRANRYLRLVLTTAGDPPVTAVCQQFGRRISASSSGADAEVL